MEKTKLIIFIACILIITGCDIFSSSDEVERTYPEAFDFGAVLISDLFNEVEPPDSVNINAFVFDIHECPENAACILPDRIAVSENLPPADTLYITAVKPSQFQIQKQYQISLLITKRETKERPDIRLLGYNLIK